MKKFIVILSCFLTTAILYAQKEHNACFDGNVYRYTIKGEDGMQFHWRAENGTIVNKDTLNDTIFIKWNKSGTQKLKVFGEIDGCYTDWREMKVNLNNPPIFALGNNIDKKIDLCEGDTFSFTPAIDTTVYSIKWKNGSNNLQYSASKSEKVWASIFDKNGCKVSDTVDVWVHSLPQVNLGPDTMLCGDQKLVLNALSAIYDGTIYKWKMKNSNDNYVQDPSVEIGKGEGEYSVTVIDAYGCISYDTVRIFKCTDVFDRKNIQIAFTPNGDGKNDTWVIQGLADEYPNAIVDVYDRGGRLVYRSEKGYPKPWDGRDRNKSALPMASYFYIINLNNAAGDKIPGTLNILR